MDIYVLFIARMYIILDAENITFSVFQWQFFLKLEEKIQAKEVEKTNLQVKSKVLKIPHFEP